MTKTLVVGAWLMSMPCGWAATHDQGKSELGLSEAAIATEARIASLRDEVGRLGREHGLAPGLSREVQELGAAVGALQTRLGDLKKQQAAQIEALQRQVAEAKSSMEASMEACHLGAGGQACDNRVHLRNAVKSILEGITKLPEIKLSERAGGEFAVAEGVDVYRAAYIITNVANALPAVSQLIECGRLDDAISLIHAIKLPRIYKAGEHLPMQERHYSVAQVDCQIRSAIELLLRAKSGAGS